MNRLGNVGTFPGIFRKGFWRFLGVLGGNLDGLPGLEKTSKQTLLPAKRNPILVRKVHLTRSVLTRVPRELKPSGTDELRSIFKTSLEKKASHSFP